MLPSNSSKNLEILSTLLAFSEYMNFIIAKTYCVKKSERGLFLVRFGDFIVVNSFKNAKFEIIICYMKNSDLRKDFFVIIKKLPLKSRKKDMERKKK